MFKVELKNTTLKEILTVLSVLVDEAKFNITENGIEIKAVDPAHVAMVKLSIDKSAFENYNATEIELGIDIAKLTEFSRLNNATDTVIIEHDEKTNKLICRCNNLTRRMALVETEGFTDPKLPELKLPVEVIIKTAELNSGIKASESIADHITIKVTPNGFELTSEGETDSVELRLTIDMLERLDCKDEVKSLFSLDYFTSMIRSVISSEMVTMHLGTDCPIKLEFDIAGGDGNVEFMLAPRIETD